MIQHGIQGNLGLVPNWQQRLHLNQKSTSDFFFKSCANAAMSQRAGVPAEMVTRRMSALARRVCKMVNTVQAWDSLLENGMVDSNSFNRLRTLAEIILISFYIFHSSSSPIQLRLCCKASATTPTTLRCESTGGHAGSVIATWDRYLHHRHHRRWHHHQVFAEGGTVGARMSISTQTGCFCSSGGAARESKGMLRHGM